MWVTDRNTIHNMKSWTTVHVHVAMRHIHFVHVHVHVCIYTCINTAYSCTCMYMYIYVCRCTICVYTRAQLPRFQKSCDTHKYSFSQMYTVSTLHIYQHIQAEWILTSGGITWTQALISSTSLWVSLTGERYPPPLSPRIAGDMMF